MKAHDYGLCLSGPTRQTIDITPDQVDAARRTVAAHALDDEDLRQLLVMLGLG